MPDQILSDQIEKILAERKRQIAEEGYTPGHDLVEHGEGDLGLAAACYAAGEDIYTLVDMGYQDAWPWRQQFDKRKKHNRERQLVIAGALILAELERLEALKAYVYVVFTLMRGQYAPIKTEVFTTNEKGSKHMTELIKDGTWERGKLTWEGKETECFVKNNTVLMYVKVEVQ